MRQINSDNLTLKENYEKRFTDSVKWRLKTRPKQIKNSAENLINQIKEKRNLGKEGNIIFTEESKSN